MKATTRHALKHAIRVLRERARRAGNEADKARAQFGRPDIAREEEDARDADLAAIESLEELLKEAQ